MNSLRTWRICVVIGIFLMTSTNCFSQFQELEKKAKKGSVKAQLELAGYWKLRNNMESACYWYQKAAEQGNSKGYWGLVNLYEETGNYAKAVEWLEKGVCESKWIGITLGDYYYEGKGVTKDYEKAAKYYEKGLSDKDSKGKNGEWSSSQIQLCTYALAVCCDSIGKYNEAIKWYKETYEGVFGGFGSQKQERIQALLGLVRLYHLGLGEKKDSVIVEHYMNLFLEECQSKTLAADYIIAWWIPDSPINTRPYENEMADFSISYALTLGSKNALFLMARSYEEGWFGYPRSAKVARIMYEKIISEASNYVKIILPVMGRLGLMYYLGNGGIKMDSQKAYNHLYAASTDKNFKDEEVAKYLSFCYRDGVGTNIDSEKQNFWEKKAAELGDKTAAEWLVQDMKAEAIQNIKEGRSH